MEFKKLSLIMAMAAILCLIPICFANADIVKAQPDVDLSAASISSVYPETVLPGTLFCINGAKFGETPGKIKIGDVVVNEFLAWDSKAIWLRIPQGVKTGDTVKIGDAVSKAKLTLAPAGSIKVVWKLDMAKVQEMVTAKSADYSLAEPAKFKKPISIKGQWVKNGNKAGNFDSGWNGGAKVLMFKDGDSDIWISEFVFTPDNRKTFRTPMYFAFEDNNSQKRKLSSFESDAAFILKKEWAASDDQDSENDPGAQISTESKNYNAADNTIYLQFPIVK